MSEPRRRWFVDIWDDDDPALARMRDALAPRPVAAPGAGGLPVVAPESTPTPDRSAVERRSRVASLVQRIKAGDLSAVDLLRELLK
jgi:hypothetical protein